MTNENNLKFLFAGLMVVLGLISRVDQDNFQKLAVQENIENTSLTASTKSTVAVPAAVPEDKMTNAVSILSPAFSENLIYRKNWGLMEPEMRTQSAVAKLLHPDFDFYLLNQSGRWPLASLTKLMTAVVAFEDLDRNQVIKISPTAVAAEGPAGNLEVDEEYAVFDLLKAMLVVSSNDAAQAIAEFYGPDFVAVMNKKALALGMRETSFADATGLSFLNQSNAEDLSKLAKYIYNQRPEILEITRQKSAKIMDLSKNKVTELLNINNFAFNNHPDFLGGKTGFTDQAGGNLLSIFDHNGKKVLVIVLGTENRFGETEKLYNWVKEAYSF